MGFFSKAISTIAGAAVGGLSSGSPVGALLGGLSGLGSVADNDTNFSNQMALQQQGQQWQEHMVDKQNLWNSAPEQAKRYREAGINPVLALGNGQPGIVSSGGSSGTNSAPPVSNPALSAEHSRLLLEKDAIESQAAKNRAEAAKAEAEADTENKMRILRMIFQGRQNKILSHDAAIKSFDEIFARDTLDMRKDIVFNERSRTSHEATLAYANAQMALFNKEHQNERFTAELAQIYQNIALAAAQGDAARAQAEASRAFSMLNSALAAKEDYSPEQLKSMQKGTVDMITANARMMTSDSNWQSTERILKWLFGGIGAASGFYRPK